MPDKDDSKNSTATAVGIGLVFGAGVGAVVFALTGNPVWIGIGSGAGLIVGSVIGARPTGGASSSPSARAVRTPNRAQSR